MLEHQVFDTPQEVGKLIRYFRNRQRQENGKHWTQLDLSLAVGWENPSTLSRIEKGEVSPKRDTILKFAEALKLDIQDTNLLLRTAGRAEYKEPLTAYFLRNFLKDIRANFNTRAYPIFVLGPDAKIVFFNHFAAYFFFNRKLEPDALQTTYWNMTHIDLCFNRKYGVKERIQNWKYISRILTENAYDTLLNNPELSQYMTPWLKYPDFKKNWQACENAKVRKHTLYNIPFVFKHDIFGLVHLLVSTFSMYEDRRFVIEQMAPATDEDARKMTAYAKSIPAFMG